MWWLRAPPGSLPSETKANLLLSHRMAVRLCAVSFTDQKGMTHTTEVEAETLYEAGVVALRRFRDDLWGEKPGPSASLAIEVRAPSVKHDMTVQALEKWLASRGRTPEEHSRKVRLKMLLMTGR